MRDEVRCYHSRPKPFASANRSDDALAHGAHRTQTTSMTTSLSDRQLGAIAPPRGAACRARPAIFPSRPPSSSASRQPCSEAAKRGGATAAETEVSQAIGQSVTVRKGEVETIAYNRDKGISVTVYVGQRRGHASTADFADEAIRATVEQGARDRALHRRGSRRRARRSATAGATSWPDLDLYHPWDLVGRARRSSSAARPRPRRSRSTSASPTARARRSRAANRSSSTRTRTGLLRRLSQLAPSHRLLGDRRGRRRDAARLLVHGGARAGGPDARRGSRTHRRRAHGAPAERAPARARSNAR